MGRRKISRKLAVKCLRKYKIKPVGTRLKMKRNSQKKPVTSRNCLKLNKNKETKVTFNDLMKRYKTWVWKSATYSIYLWNIFFSHEVLSRSIKISFFRKYFICSSLFKLRLWYIYREIFSRHREQNCWRFSFCFYLVLWHFQILSFATLPFYVNESWTLIRKRF